MSAPSAKPATVNVIAGAAGAAPRWPAGGWADAAAANSRPTIATKPVRARILVLLKRGMLARRRSAAGVLQTSLIHCAHDEDEGVAPRPCLRDPRSRRC